MKQATLILVFLFICTSLWSQDYLFFQPDEQYYYQNKSEYFDVTSSPVCGMKVSSLGCVDLYETMEVEYVPRIPLFLSGNDYTVVPSFAGIGICQYPDSILMDVGRGEPLLIRQQSAVGEPWVFSETDSFLITGVVDSIKFMQVEEGMDSVKYINFYLGDSLLLDQPVELAKANGLLRGAYFWDLPAARETLPRIFSPNIQDVTSDSIFNFSAGDEIHVEQNFYYYDDDVQIHDIRQKVINVLAVRDSNGIVLVDYDVDELRYKTKDYFRRNDNSDSTLVLNQTRSGMYGRSWLGAQPGALLPVTLFNLTGGFRKCVVRVDQCNGNWRKFQAYPVSGVGLYEDTGYTFDLPFGESYVAKAGGPYWALNSQGEGFEERRLVYASALNDGCLDDRFTFADGLINSTDNVWQEDISISPNPIQSTFKVSTSNGRRLSFSVYDARGAQVSEMIEGDAEVDVSGLKAGVYFVRIQLPEGGVVVRKVLVL